MKGNLIASRRRVVRAGALLATFCRADQRAQLTYCGPVEYGIDAERDPEPLLKPGRQTDGEERIAAELKEIVTGVPDRHPEDLVPGREDGGGYFGLLVSALNNARLLRRPRRI